jgi:protein-disulfide isomerase/uncharacterized membrane protein
MSDFMNCNTTTASKFSEFFGIPMAILGALLNFLLLLGLAAHKWPLANEKTREQLPTTLKLMSLFVFLTSVVMGGISLMLLKSLCPFCMASYGLSLITLISIWGYLPKGSGFSFGIFELKAIPALLLTTLVVGFFVHKVSLSKFGGKELQEFTTLQFQSWRDQIPKEINTVDPIVMNASQQAKMKIVEFADFLCGHCANAFPKLHTFVKAHPDVQFSFQAFPLDGACNPEISRSVGAPCQLAKVSHCAEKQGKGWETQKWIFENQRDLYTTEKIDEQLPGFVSRQGINEDQLKACVDSEETHKTITEQAALGKDVGVKGTPTVFVNGKKVPGVSLPVLELIYNEVKNQ